MCSTCCTVAFPVAAAADCLRASVSDMKSNPPLWKKERLGLSMIASSLVAIVIIAGLLFDYLKETKKQTIRTHGVSLIRTLTALPFRELAPESNPAAVLSALQLSASREYFAYAAIVDATGATIVERVAPGLLLPGLEISGNRTSWMGEHVFEKTGSHPRIQEFHAPLLSEGELSGYLRLGYFEPGYGLTPTQIAFVATLALVIFLLTPLFYFLVRREIRPLEQAGSKLRDLVQEGQFQSVDITASGELGQFMNNFNQFVTYANNRVAELESDRERVLTSTKLLSYRKERIVRVIESFPEGILLFNEAGNVTVANRQLEAVLGVDADAIVGADNMDWCEHDEVRDYLNLCRVGGRYLPEPLEFNSEVARNKHFVITAYPLFMPDGTETIGCLVVVRDITVETLARAGRAEFVAHVAHEFKTPLNVLALYSEALQRADPDDHETRIDAANVIEEEVGRLSSLINNMLNLTRIEMGSMDVDTQRVRVRDLIEDVFKNVKHMRLASGIEFDLKLPAQITPLQLDKELIRIALNNFLTNAVKYNKPNGKVTLVVEEFDEVVRISVADTGIGIATDDLPKIFDKFYRSDESEVRERSGHGLGLALARDIIELHNGSVTAESTPGEGTVFTIDLWKIVPAMKQVS